MTLGGGGGRAEHVGKGNKDKVRGIQYKDNENNETEGLIIHEI